MGITEIALKTDKELCAKQKNNMLNINVNKSGVKEI